jgi:tryptophan 2,3-dioxygenase
VLSLARSLYQLEIAQRALTAPAQLPQRIIESMIEIDQQLTAWRYRHASMVNRMIGAKMGTGGSSGFAYLKATASHHRIFDDFFNLSMFLLPRSVRPKLPANVQAKVRFFYESER